MAKKNKIPTKKQARQMGYTSFSQDTFHESSGTNVRARELFNQMLLIPKKVQKKVAQGKGHKIKENDYYPTSMEEILQMEDLLNQSYAATTDKSDTEFMEALDEMADILNWSKTRQWNFNWAIIVGVLLFVCLLWYWTSDEKEVVERSKAKLEQIKTGNDSLLYAYKIKTLREDSTSVEYYKKYVADYKARLDTVKDKELKKRYTKYVTDYEKTIVEKQNRVTELKKADKVALLKIATDDYSQDLKRSKGSHTRMLLWTLFFILLIPLYVIAERPYGFMISKHRLEGQILAWIRKIMFWLAGGFVAWAGAIQVTETVTTYTDGSKETDSDAIPVMAMKLILLIIAACIFVGTSIALMLYATIVGLSRNYDWKAEFQKISTKS